MLKLFNNKYTRTLSFFTAALLLLPVLLFAGGTQADAPAISIQAQAPDCVVPGDIFTVYVSANATSPDVSGLSVKLPFDATRLDFLYASSITGSPDDDGDGGVLSIGTTNATLNGADSYVKYVYVYAGQDDPAQLSGSDLFSVTFRAKADMATGTGISLVFTPEVTEAIDNSTPPASIPSTSISHASAVSSTAAAFSVSGAADETHAYAVHYTDYDGFRRVSVKITGLQANEAVADLSAKLTLSLTGGYAYKDGSLKINGSNVLTGTGYSCETQVNGANRDFTFRYTGQMNADDNFAAAPVPASGLLIEFDLTTATAKESRTLDGVTLTASGSRLKLLTDGELNDNYTGPAYSGTPTRSVFELIGDFNNDGSVDIVDMSLFLSCYGKKTGDAGYNDKYDLKDSGQIDIADFSLFLSHYGEKA